MLLKTVDELMYENDVLDLPYTPDVADYLQQRVFFFATFVLLGP
jgi:hypothetical protein